jgi:hypothetical protein
VRKIDQLRSILLSETADMTRNIHRRGRVQESGRLPWILSSEMVHLPVLGSSTTWDQWVVGEVGHHKGSKNTQRPIARSSPRPPSIRLSIYFSAPISHWLPQLFHLSEPRAACQCPPPPPCPTAAPRYRVGNMDQATEAVRPRPRNVPLAITSARGLLSFLLLLTDIYPGF